MGQQFENMICGTEPHIASSPEPAEGVKARESVDKKTWKSANLIFLKLNNNRGALQTLGVAFGLAIPPAVSLPFPGTAAVCSCLVLAGTGCLWC